MKEIEVDEDIVKAIITLKDYCTVTCCRECVFYGSRPCPVSRFPARTDIKEKTVYMIVKENN